MFKLLQHFALYAAILALAACSAVTVTTDFDPSATFDKYHTYELKESKEGQQLSPSSEKAFRDALRNNLAAQGIREVTDNADLYVLRYVSTKEKTVVYQTYDFGYDYGYGFGRYGAWPGVPRNYTDVSQYTEGTLIIDFVDAKTQKLVFRGIGKGVLSDPQTNAKHISEAVQKIIRAFPKSKSR
jgi:Domain of unknown function (DUF4136)